MENRWEMDDPFVVKSNLRKGGLVLLYDISSIFAIIRNYNHLFQTNRFVHFSSVLSPISWIHSK